MNTYYTDTAPNKAQLTKEGMDKYFSAFLKATTYANRQFFQNCRKFELIPRLFIVNGVVKEWLDTKEDLLLGHNAFCLYCGHHVSPTSNGKIIHGVQNSKCISVSDKAVTIKTNTSGSTPQAEIAQTNKMTSLNHNRLNKLMAKAKKEASRQAKAISVAVKAQVRAALRNIK